MASKRWRHSTNGLTNVVPVGAAQRLVERELSTEDRQLLVLAAGFCDHRSATLREEDSASWRRRRRVSN